MDAAFTSHCPRLRITVDHAYVDSDLSDFPVLVRLTHSPLSGVRTDRADLFFSADGGGAPMAFEVERFDRNAGELVAWVRLPLVSSAQDTVFYLRYADGSATPRENGPATWAPAFGAVYHMQSAGGSAPQPDSTSNANHAVPDTSGCSPDVRDRAAGAIGTALEFGRTNCTRLVAADSSSLDASSTLTVSAWVYPTTDGTAATEAILSKRQRVSENANYQVGLSNTPHSMYFMWGSGNGYYPSIISDTPVDAVPPKNTWSHVAWTVSGSPLTLRMYINGVRVNAEQKMSNAGSTSGASIALVPNDFPLFIGGMDQETDEPFKGHLDEVRVTLAARNLSWIRAEFENQRAGSAFLSFVDE